MTNQYVPKTRSDKVFTACPIRQGTAQQKPSSGKLVDQYITYDRWEMFDDDFTLFYNVLLNDAVDDFIYTDTIVVRTDEVPHGATILSSFKSSTPPAALNPKIVESVQQPQQPTPEAVYAAAKSIIMVQNVSFPEAMRLAQARLSAGSATSYGAPGHVVPAAPPIVVVAAVATAIEATSGACDTQPRPEVQYTECNVTRTIGPFNKGTKFDIMAFSSLTREGVVHRNNSEKYYVLAFHTDGSQKIPRLTRDFTKQRIPPCFRNISFANS